MNNALSLSDNSKSGKLQQQLFDARIAKLNSGLFVLATSLDLQHGTHTETLMLNDAPLA